MQLFVVVLLNIIANTGFGVVLPVMPGLLQISGFSIAGLSLPFIAIVVGRIMSKSFCTKIAGSFRYKNVVATAFILYTFIFLLYMVAQNPWHLIALRFAEGLVEGIIVVILTDITLALSKQENRAFYMGIFGASFGIGMVIGPLYGGIILQKFGIDAIFATNAVLGGVGALSTIFLHQYGVQNQEKMYISWNLLKLIAFYSPAMLRRVYLFSFAIFLPIYCRKILQMSLASTTTIFTMIATVLIILGPLSGKIVDRLNCRLVTIYGSIGMCFCCVLIFLNIHFFTFFTIMLIFFGITMPAGMKFFGDKIQNNPNRTQIIGFAGSCTEFVTLFVAVCIPFVAEINIAYPWLFLAIVGLLAIIPYLREE